MRQGRWWGGDADPEHLSNRHAFITGSDVNGMRDLGGLYYGYLHSSATDINNDGQVVGMSYTAEGELHAFITGPNGHDMRDLGTLRGTFSSATGINDAGQVVGNSYTADGISHPFITRPNGIGIIDLISLAKLPEGFSAVGINNLGQVIVTTIPEPSSYSLLLAGLGLVGFMVHRQKQQTA